MQKHINILKITRNNILSAIEGLTREELNTIPHGFNNNIIWNVAHILVTQQVLIYKLSYLPPVISEDFINKYKKGTSIEHEISEEEIQLIKTLLHSTIDQLEEDIREGIFAKYQEYTTSYNITLKSSEDAIIFNNVHEGLHLGYIMAMKKAI